MGPVPPPRVCRCGRPRLSSRRHPPVLQTAFLPPLGHGSDDSEPDPPLNGDAVEPADVDTDRLRATDVGIRQGGEQLADYVSPFRSMSWDNIRHVGKLFDTTPLASWDAYTNHRLYMTSCPRFPGSTCWWPYTRGRRTMRAIPAPQVRTRMCIRAWPASVRTPIPVRPASRVQKIPAPHWDRKLFQRLPGCSPDSGLDPGTVMGFSFQESPMPFLMASRRFILA